MTQNIIFDLGRVLINQPEDIATQIVQTTFPHHFEKAFALWEDYKKEVVLGKKTSFDYLDRCKELFRLTDSEEDLYTAWKNAYKANASANSKMLAFVDNLKNKYNIYILTDTIDAHFEVAKSLGIFTHVKQVFASYVEHYRKEDGKAFENLLVKLHAKGQECLFIDDVQKNINLAKEYDIQTILFTNQEELEKEMKGLGVI